MTYRVFLSHDSSDFGIVQDIIGNAQVIDVEVYAHEHDPQPGRSIAEKVREEIRRSNAVIAVLTEKGVYSNYVQQEMGYAQGRRKLVIPLVEAGVSKTRLAMLEGIEYILLDRKDPAHAMSRLTKRLEGLKAGKESSEAILALAGLGVLVLFALGGRSS